MQQITRVLRFISLSSIIVAVSFMANAQDEDVLPPVHISSIEDFIKEGQQARESRLPILVMFSQVDCSYCRFVEEEYLKPMLRNAGYREKIIIRRVMTDDFRHVTDFDGNKVTTLQLSSRYGAFVSPTIVFLNHEGKELAPRIHGVRNTEMYGYDLDKNIDDSLARIRQQLAANY